MEKEEKLDYLRYMNGLIFQQLSFSEAKHGFIIAADTALIGAAVGVGSTVNVSAEAAYWENPTIWSVVGWVSFFALISMVISIRSLFPNLKKIGRSKGNLNTYFHKDIASMTDSKQYDDCLEDGNEIEDLENENIQVARIIDKKNERCKVSALLMLHGIFPLILLYDVAIAFKWLFD
jgi:hypothetical protein